MLNLHYIIIGDLQGRQRSYLEQNLIADEAGKKGVKIVAFAENGERIKERADLEYHAETETVSRNRLENFPAQKSIFISGNYKELQTAIGLGMATLGYLLPDKSARELQEISGEYKENRKENSCPNTDMWAEGFDEIGLEFLIHVYERHHGIPWTILTTERCVIKEFSMDYLDELFELYDGEGMTDYIEPLYPYEQEKEYQEAYIKYMYGFYGYGMWIVCEKQTGKLIGRAGVEHREELGGELELGYAISVPYQRQGYATEVCKAILEYAKKELMQSSVCCLIEKDNAVSEHFAEKLGFRQEGTVVVGEKQMKKYIYVF